jgi:protein-S-isoprenylcysteine O-methyltransferase Ste14
MVDIQRVQLWRKYILAAGLAVMLAWTATVRAVPYLEHPVEHLGLVSILACILGRAWCSLYIGGRKKQEIVDVGPYSISRNPLYVFSFLGAFGVGAQTGSLVVAVVFAAAAYGVFRVVVGREEAFLVQAFGPPYEAYVSSTPRFLPNLSLWRDADVLSIRPVFFLRTVRDGLVFLLAVPVFELSDITTCPNVPVSIGLPDNASYTYAWNNTVGMADPNEDSRISNPTVTIGTTQDYEVVVTHVSSGCSIKENIRVILYIFFDFPRLEWMCLPLLRIINNMK